MKIDRETATAEVEKWFEKKKIKESQKTTQRDAVSTLIDSVMDGDLVLNDETNEFTHNLLFPFEGETPLKALVYKSRLNDTILKPHLEGNKIGSGTDMMLSYIAALTNAPKAILAKLDSGDKRIATSIAVFFM